MKTQEACIIVLKAHKFDRLLQDWLFASTKEERLKARKIYCSVRSCGGERATMKKIQLEVETAIQKAFYTIENKTTDVISYHAIDTSKLTLRDWMINHLDMSCDYETFEGYKEREVV